MRRALLGRLAVLTASAVLALASVGCGRRTLLVARPDPPPEKPVVRWEIERDPSPLPRPRPRPGSKEAASAPKAPKIPPEIEAQLGPLRKHPFFGGSSIPRVGRLGGPAPFYVVGKAILEKASADDLAALAADPDPIVRAMGLWGYAKRREAGPLLESMCDGATVPESGGCLGPASVSIGAIASELLDDPERLEMSPGRERTPLVTDDASRALSARLLASDHCSAPPWSLRASFNGGRITFGGLRMQAPKVPAWKLVKAAARDGADRIGPLMIAILEDEKLPVDARLAAASGLTRARPTRDVDYAATIRAQADFLDGAVPGLSARLERALAIRKRAFAFEDARSAAHSAEAIAKQLDPLLALYAEPHPMLTGLLVHGESLGKHGAALRPVRGQALRALVASPSAHEECWDVDRDFAHQLREALDGRNRIDIELAMTPSELAAFETAVDATLARLDADARCR
jgi:hypothetical protein